MAPNNLPEDINHKIISDFGKKQYQLVANMLLPLNDYDRNHRIIRCVLFLAQGNRKKLEHFIEQARLDFRDVIYWAEYDASGRINDFNLPFE